MKEIYTEIEINASAGIVWDILTDFDNFPNWNPFIKKISGILQEGERIEVFIKPPNSNGMDFKPKILTCIPKKELRWLGNLWIPKLFDGEHILIIEKIRGNKVLFVQKERFSGLFVPFFSSSLMDTKDGFEMMNQALKRKVEGKESMKV